MEMKNNGNQQHCYYVSVVLNVFILLYLHKTEGAL